MSHSLIAQLTIIVEQLPPNTPDTDTIFLAGELNNWVTNNPAYQFRYDSSGVLSLKLPASARQPFEFKLTRGNWERVETNTYGQYINNRRYEGKKDTLALTVQSWDDLPVNPPHGWATLTIESIPKNTPPEATIYAVGSFNAWHPQDPAYKLQPNAEGSYKVDIPLMSDTTYYKFSRGSWETIEGQRSGRARINRSLILGKYSEEDLIAQIESWEDLAGNPINPYTFLLLLAAFQGLLLILAINTLQNNNRAANRVLSVLLLVLSVALLGRVSTYDREIFNWWPRLLLLPDFIYFLYAPVFLIYINRLLRLPGQQGPFIRWWEFVPFLIHIAFYLPLMVMNKEAFIAEVVDQRLQPKFAFWGGLALVYNTAYWFVCRHIIRQYESEYGDSHAFEPNIKFLRVVMWLKFACLLIWGLTYLIGGMGWLTETNLRSVTDKTTDTLWVVFSLTTFFLGYYTMRQPEIFKLPAADAPPSPQGLEDRERAASMDEGEMMQIKKKLEAIMSETQTYRNPGLSLNQLAEMVGTSLHSLSMVINEGYDMNFNDFINSYRIGEFKKLVEEDTYKNHTLLAIAFIVGFNSKSAFNRSFKKLEGCTPREFVNAVAD